jgi:SAM-dependent methyltransferase
MSDQQKEIIARDEQAESYEQWYGQRGVLYNYVEKKVVIDALNLQKDDIVLDAGCGTGRIAREMASRCKKVYGIDFSPKSIEWLNKKLQEQRINNIEASVGDITGHLPIKEKVDKVLSVQTIQHIPTEDERFLALKNLYNQLKPGGVCVITLYNWGSFLDRKLVKEDKFSNGVYYFRFTPTEVETMFKKCGFKNVRANGCMNFRWYAILNNRAFRWLFYPVARFDVLLSNFKISRFFGAYVVCKGIK